MASQTYNAPPVKRAARKKFFNRARMGSRPARTQPDIGDAFHAVSAAAAIKDGWSSSTDPAVVALRNAWNARKDS